MVMMMMIGGGDDGDSGIGSFGRRHDGWLLVIPVVETNDDE